MKGMTYFILLIFCMHNIKGICVCIIIMYICTIQDGTLLNHTAYNRIVKFKIYKLHLLHQNVELRRYKVYVLNTKLFWQLLSNSL